MKITVATSIKHGNYKEMQYNVKRMSNLIKRNWAHVCEWVGINPEDDIVIHFRPIPGRVRGEYNSGKAIINLDVRKLNTSSRLIEVLGHELQHHKQYTEGVLAQKYNAKTNKWLSIWKGKSYKRATTHNAYWNRPWEVEARCAGALVKEMYHKKVSHRWQMIKNS